jgi:invasion protein IalB
MKKSTAIAILVAAIVAAAGAGAVLYFRSATPPPQPPQLTIPQLPPGTQTFGNWALVCGQAQEGQDAGRCGLLMRVIDQQAQRVLMSLTVSRGPQGNAIMVINTPPGVVIPAGVSLTPENGTAETGGIQVCRPQGCTGVILLTETLISEMSTVTMTALGYTAATGQPVNLNLPTTGFAEGFAAWQTAYPAPPPPAEEGAEAAPE